MQDSPNSAPILGHLASQSTADRDAQLAQLVEHLEKERRENPRIVVQLICDAVLTPDDINGNPFAFAFRAINARGYPPPVRRFAEVLRYAMTGGGRPTRDGYLSFLDLIAKWFESENIELEISKSETRLINASADGRRVLIDAIPYYLFRACSWAAASAIDSVAAYVHEGLPLYRRSEKGEFQIVPHTDGLYQYIAKMGEFAEGGAKQSIPDWTEEVFFREMDFAVHELYFEVGADLSPDAFAARRDALRNALGLRTTPISAEAARSIRRVYDTKLLGHVQAVINRFYGDQFVESDPNTYTSQAIVVEWLMTEAKLSKRQAEAVDIVTRPDAVRGRSTG